MARDIFVFSRAWLLSAFQAGRLRCGGNVRYGANVTPSREHSGSWAFHASHEKSVRVTKKIELGSFFFISSSIRSGVLLSAVAITLVFSGMAPDLAWSNVREPDEKKLSNEECLSDPPEFSHDAGLYDEGFSLELSATQGARIYYRLDGGAPRLNRKSREEADRPRLERAMRYRGPIAVNKATLEPSKYAGRELLAGVHVNREKIPHVTLVRAVAVEPGCKPSRVNTATFFVGLSEDLSTLPVFSVATDPDALFRKADGIYGQEGASQTRHSANIELFQAGDAILSNEGSIAQRVEGEVTFPMRSIEFYGSDDCNSFQAGSEYSYVKGNGCRPLLILDNGGFPDFLLTMYRNLLASRVADNVSVPMVPYKPAIYFMNGEFWGFTLVRGSLNDAIGNHSGISGDANVDILRYSDVGEEIQSLMADRRKDYHDIDDFIDDLMGGEVEADLESPISDYVQLFRDIDNKDISGESGYAELANRMDILLFARYAAFHIYAENQSWPESNVIAWRGPLSGREHDTEGWSWIIEDMSGSFGGSPYTGRGHPLSENFLEDAASQRGPSPAWSTKLLSALLESDPFREFFINMLADMGNSYFRPLETNRILGEMEEQFGFARELHARRWPSSLRDQDQQALKGFFVDRPQAIREQVMDVFDVGPVSRVLVIYSSGNHERGFVRINSIEVRENEPGVLLVEDEEEGGDVWGGHYFKGNPVWIEAVPASGYRFSRWKEEDVKDKVLVFTPSSEFHRFTPIFEKK